MLRKIIFIILIISSTNSYSQRLFSFSKDFDLFYNYTRWGVQLDGLAYFPATYTGFNQYSFKSQYGIGYKFGLVYNINLSNHFGFKIGALAGQVPVINNYFVLDNKDIGTSNDYVHKNQARYSPIFNYSFPVLFEYRNFMINRFTLSLAAGIQVELTGASTITDAYKNYYAASATNPGNWDMDLIFKAGWYFQFKPLMLQTSVVYKYRFRDQYTGFYQFNLPSNPPAHRGTYIQKGNYIGLSFNFYFHRPGREVDMGCRANTQSSQVRKRQKRQQREKEKARKRIGKIDKKKAKKIRNKAKKRWIFW